MEHGGQVRGTGVAGHRAGLKSKKKVTEQDGQVEGDATEDQRW